MTHACAHHHCRTYLDDESAVQCPHGLAFCQHCTWEEACDECAIAARIPDLNATLDRAIEAARELRPVVKPRAVVLCRCGAREDQGRQIKPARDLRGKDGVAVVDRADSLRWCRACPHGIHVGASYIRWNPRERTSTAVDFYHNECAVIA